MASDNFYEPIEYRWSLFIRSIFEVSQNAFPIRWVAILQPELKLAYGLLVS